MVSQSFKLMLAQRKAKGVKKKRLVPPKWLFPSNAERQYDKLLYSLVNEMKRLIKEVLLPEIPSMIQEVESKMPNDRQDDFLSRLNRLIIFIRASMKDKVESTILGSKVIGAEIAAFNKVQFEKTNQSVFGIDLFVDEPWLPDQIELFASQNSQLIRSIPDQELERVAGEIERGLQQGERFTDIAKSIQKSFGITHRRAKLIARDQTTKLNASLTRLRQQEVGISKFYWQTSGDERVRHSHALMDGKLCSWSNPNIYYKNGKEISRPLGATKTFVGQDVNCRCVARPYLEDLLDV